MAVKSYAKRVADKLGHKCPQCGGSLRTGQKPTGKNHFPFCSERCQLLDLGKWASEEFRIAGKRPHESKITSDEDLE